LEVTLLRRDGVEVTGTVASVQPYLRAAAVYGNALFEGAGSSLKVLQALASGVPLVSTATGVRGHALEPMRHYLPAESADSFAETILRVLAGPALFDAQAIAGRAVAESKSWARVGESFAALVASVARRETIARVPGRGPGKAPSGP
jgi:glycosyltransferase involved in cell wall biosynthesis